MNKVSIQPAPETLEVILARAVAAATPSLEFTLLADGQAWALSAEDRSARLLEMLGILDPARPQYDSVIARFATSIRSRPGCAYLTAPDFARAVHENWPTSPFYRMPDRTSRLVVVLDCASIPRSYANPTSPPPVAVTVERAQTERQRSVAIAFIADEYYPDRDKHKLATALLRGLSESDHSDLLLYSMGATKRPVGAGVICYYGEYAYPLFNMVQRRLRGGRLFRDIIVAYPRFFASAGVRYLVGDIPHPSARPGYLRLFRASGATVSHTRCFYFAPAIA